MQLHFEIITLCQLIKMTWGLTYFDQFLYSGLFLLHFNLPLRFVNVCKLKKCSKPVDDVCDRLAIHPATPCGVEGVIDIGVGRFRILGGQGLEYWGGGKFPAGT